jgi:hypothetical protein
MKKILLCTTALVGLAGSALAADMSSNSDMQVSIGGTSKFEAGYVKRDADHKKAFTYSPNQSNSAFLNSNKVALKAEGKTDSMTYGAVVRLQTVASMSNGMSESGLDRSHIFMNTDMGAVQLGTNFAASKLMSVDAGTIASATGGVTGDYSDFIDVRENTVFGGMPVFSTDTLTNRLDGYGESNRKITYLSPRISGAQLGLSFAPDMENNGGEGMSRDNGKRYLGRQLAAKNLISLAFNYKNSFNDVNVTFSAAGDFAKAKQDNYNADQWAVNIYNRNVDGTNGALLNSGKYNILPEGSDVITTTERNDIKTYSVGTVVEYQGFSAALSYGHDGKSLAPKNADFTSYWYTAGLGYKNGPMSTSLTYLYGKKGNKAAAEGDTTTAPLVKTSAVSLGADYIVAPGMKPFAEVTYATVKPNRVINGNTKAKSTVFILGTRLQF